MRKKIAAALAALWACVGIVGFAACDDDTTSAPEHQWDDNTVSTPEHQWDEGTVTTAPTCMTPGVITYVCQDCGEERKEPLDKNGEHHFGDYETNVTSHWRTCTLCGETETAEHTLSAADGRENEACTVCGYEVPLNEYAYEITFEGEHVTITVYRNDDYTAAGEQTTTAWSRDGDTGVLLKNGEGQVNFKIEVDLGYKLSEEAVTVSPKTYKNLKDPSETGAENTYRITKITGDIIVTVHTEIDALDLPVMEINTENAAPIVDKENYVSCEVSVSNTGEGGYTLANASAGIRGRGNSTWEMPKKPYRIKFDEKTDLFHNGEAKNWTLIANYCDKSLMRNYLAYTIGGEMTAIKDTTTTVQMVELYLNGSYEGVYLVCEQNEVGKNRVNIEDDINQYQPDAIGYLLELDARVPTEGAEDIDYVVVEGVPFAIKSPDYGDIESNDIEWVDYVSYIKGYLQDVFAALRSEDWAQVQSYIDADSFAESYIVHELFHMVDVGYSSFYVYKKGEAKELFSGPVWDFDVSSGNCNYQEDAINPEYLWAAERNIFYQLLLTYDEFRALVKEKLSSYQNTISGKIENADDEAQSLSRSFDRNFVRWQILGVEISPNPPELVAIDTWQGQIEYLQEWLQRSLAYMVSVYCGTGTAK